jgi:glucosamine--fructose-6-phosphate aminotransferase (isomerizing)
LNLKRALVIGVSQSGEGADINLVMQRAKDCGAITLGITNDANSAMAQIADET